MLISERYNFLFVHIPKTGGISIRTILLPYCLHTRKRLPGKLISKLGLDFNWRWHHFRLHATLSEAEKTLPTDVFESMLKFTVVRNPWAKLVSSYHFEQQRKGHRHSKNKVRQMAFSDYLRYTLKKRKRSAHTFLQKRQIVGLDGNVGVNVILRQETLQSDWDQLVPKLNIDDQLVLPRKNTSQHKDYRSYYSDEDIEFVRRHWQEDIEAFGYDFE